MKKSVKLITCFVGVLILSVSFSPIIMGNKAESNQNETIFIDENIHLTMKHFPLLKYAQLANTDSDVEKLLNDFIIRIQEKGTIDNNDVEQIIIDSNIDITAIHFFKFIYGYFNLVYGLFNNKVLYNLIGLLTPLGGIFPYVSPYLDFNSIGEWRVNFRLYYHHDIYSIGFFG